VAIMDILLLYLIHNIHAGFMPDPCHNRSKLGPQSMTLEDLYIPGTGNPHMLEVWNSTLPQRPV
jgi:hypothetical protein